jgi:phosphohistidine phosphatase
LLRHAKAVPTETAPDDFDRELNSRGIAAARAVGGHLAVTKLQPDLVLCSTAARARETFAQLVPAFSHEYRAFLEHRLYMASAPKIIERLQEIGPEVRCAMLIGHNPGLERAARMLAGSGPQELVTALGVKYPTAALAVFEFDAESWKSVGKDSARLADFICPRDLED